MQNNRIAKTSQIEFIANVKHIFVRIFSQVSSVQSKITQMMSVFLVKRTAIWKSECFHNFCPGYIHQHHQILLFLRNNRCSPISIQSLVHLKPYIIEFGLEAFNIRWNFVISDKKLVSLLHNSCFHHQIDKVPIFLYFLWCHFFWFTYVRLIVVQKCNKCLKVKPQSSKITRLMKNRENNHIL